MGDAFVPVVVPRTRQQLPISLRGATQVWTSYKSVASHNLKVAVTGVSFSPVAPHTLAASHGFAVSLVGLGADKSVKSISSFHETVYSPHFRYDGRLIVAGTADGRAKVFDVSSRRLLREFKDHKRSVRTSRFSSDGLRILTGSEDSTVIAWDLATGSSLFTLTDASDYIMTQCDSPATKHVWAAGSADRKARLYDLRSEECIFTLDHGAAVADMCILPGGARAVSVGGTQVKFWDFFTGGTVVAEHAYHSKATTCVAVDSERGRLITGGLDRYVKVHDLDSFETKGVMQFGSHVLSVDYEPQSHCFAAGTVNGFVDIRSSGTRVKGAAAAPSFSGRSNREFEGWGRGFVNLDKVDGPRPGTQRYFNRGAGSRPLPDHVVAPQPIRVRLEAHDLCLKRFDHSGALDSAVAVQRPAVLKSVVEELVSRGALVSALSGREVDELVPMLRVIRRFIGEPEYVDYFTYVVHVVLDIYASNIGGVCKDVDDILKDLLVKISREVRAGRDMMKLHGCAEIIALAPRRAL